MRRMNLNVDGVFAMLQNTEQRLMYWNVLLHRTRVDDRIKKICSTVAYDYYVARL